MIYTSGRYLSYLDLSGNNLFKAGDWHCTKCGNVNWGSRKACNLCGLAREVDQGERKGAGGGYYERQDPTDRIEHFSDDDDIYDAFGRQKEEISSWKRIDDYRS